MTRQSARKSTRTRARRALQHGAVRHDTYINEASGHGTSRDRRTLTKIGIDIVTDVEALALWQSDDLMARIIELPPREATRAGFGLRIADRDGKEKAEGVMAEVERLNVLDKLKTAGQWERAFSGAAIFPVLDGAVGDLSEPLQDYEGRIVRVEALHLFEPRELRPMRWYQDVRHPKFRKPETYQLWPLSSSSGLSVSSEEIHESRLVIFPGIQISNQLQPGQRPGWGDCVLSRCRGVAADFGLAWGSAATLIHDFARGVYKLKNYADIMRRKGGREEILKRVSAMERDGSSLRGVVIDGSDDFTRSSTPVGGLADLMVQLAQRMAAAADMPVTILMGMSPAGMNATGESDIRSWYDRIAAIQSYYRFMLEQILRLIMLQTEGPLEGREPEKWSSEWTPLWQPSAKETADTRYTIAQTDKIYYDMGAATETEIAKARWGGDTFSPEMPIDWKAREAQEQLAADPTTLSPEDLAAMGRTPAGGPIVATGEAEQIVALNGAQVSSLVDVVKATINGEIPRESALNIIAVAFNVGQKKAAAILGPINFKPKAPPAPEQPPPTQLPTDQPAVPPPGKGEPSAVPPGPEAGRTDCDTPIREEGGRFGGCEPGGGGGDGGGGGGSTASSGGKGGGKDSSSGKSVEDQRVASARESVLNEKDADQAERETREKIANEKEQLAAGNVRQPPTEKLRAFDEVKDRATREISAAHTELVAAQRDAEQALADTRVFDEIDESVNSDLEIYTEATDSIGYAVDQLIGKDSAGEDEDEITGRPPPSDDELEDPTATPDNAPDPDDYEDDEEYDAAKAEHDKDMKILAERRAEFEKRAAVAQEKLEKLHQVQVRLIDKAKETSKEFEKARRAVEKEGEYDDEELLSDKFSALDDGSLGEDDNDELSVEYGKAYAAAASLGSHDRGLRDELPSSDVFDDVVPALRDAARDTASAIRVLSKVTGKKASLGKPATKRK